MKFTSIATFAAFFSAAIAQSIVPSPTNSIGCVAHDDHWHCDGPAPQTTTISGSLVTVTPASATSAHSDHDDDDHDASGTGSLAPSPTASIGCEPHGDHWHCDGPRVAGASNGTLTATTSAALVQASNAAGQNEVGAAMFLVVAGYAMVL